MMPPLISVLIPTRGRPALLKKSVRSLLDRAFRVDDIEIVCRTDRDDPSYGPHGEEIQCLHTSWAQRIGEPLGYRGLHAYYSDCAARARGEWLVIWNDDCLMRTTDWDRDLRFPPNYAEPWMVLAHNHFPAVSRRWFEATGRIAASPHTDTYLTDVAEIVFLDEPTAFRSLRREDTDAWSIHHRADELDDEGSARRKAEILGPEGTSAAFFTPAMRAEIEADAAKIVTAYRMLREAKP